MMTALPVFSEGLPAGAGEPPLRAHAAPADAACEGRPVPGAAEGAGASDGTAGVPAPDAAKATKATIAAAAQGAVIREEAIRIRILAHSDRGEDQAVKRQVRDRVTALIASWPAPASLAEARTLLRAHLAEIEAAAEAELARWDASYGAEAFLGEVPFPAKTFGGRTYPAGDYEALLITLGDGKGANWWCVLFPPLCLTGAVADDHAVADRPAKASGEAAGAGVREGGDAKGNEPRVKFFVWEWLQRLWKGLKSLFS